MSGFKLTPVTILLLASLLVNGVFIGMVLSDRTRPPGPGPFAGAGFSPGSFLREAPQSMRPLVMQAFRANDRQARELHQEARAAQMHVYQVLTAETLDLPAARDAFAELRRTRQAVDALGHDVFLTIVEPLPADDRIRMIEAGFQRMPGPRRHGERRRPDGEARN